MRLQGCQVMNKPSQMRIVVFWLAVPVRNTPNQRTHFVDGILYRIDAGDGRNFRIRLCQFSD